MVAQTADQQLHKAASEGSVSAVREALQNGAEVNARGEFGDTALNMAAEHGHLQIVEKLLASGADIENLGGADKTPLMSAAFAGNIGVVRLLLEKGAQISDDLLQSVQLKVNILKENAESGMVRPDAVEAWRGFLGMLIEARQRQQ